MKSEDIYDLRFKWKVESEEIRIMMSIGDKALRQIVFCFSILFATALSAQSLDKTIEKRLGDWFNAYETSYAKIAKCKLEKVEANHDSKRLTIYANAAFGGQPFTEETTANIYRQIKQLLPGPVNYYDISIIADGKSIESLIPNAYRSKALDYARLYDGLDYKAEPWTKNISKPYTPREGLQGRHISLWQSHGMYYKNVEDTWKWQRPRLFCTSEDLFTQAFVVKYLIPMLENAGAVVFTPRERDWQRNEVIVDNDTKDGTSKYIEVNYKKKSRWGKASVPGFAHKRDRYRDKQNPFEDGTARIITTINKPEKAFAEWIPDIPEKGRYAVYVSYKSFPESIDQAKYLVYHNGGVTEFKVNQQIGGGTWVYLGSFEFDKGINETGMVVLSNESDKSGVVCADAVRFGGGMGNIERGGKLSGMPRYLEGARYWAQWAGMPYEVYSHSDGVNDYNDDINSRSLMTNYLNGQSVYNPGEEGLGVPIELCLGFHSDSGFRSDNSIVGTLGIYTTDFNESKLATGLSRYASRDLTDMVLTGIKRDVTSAFGIDWTRRSMWNRNYSETRLPSVPSMILESMSHQNFEDLKHGLNPEFQFVFSRSVYKSILKYLATLHDAQYTVQPLPVTHFAIEQGKENTLELRWAPKDDQLEPSAKADGYIVYTKIGYGGFDNGVYVKEPRYTAAVETGLCYSFRVTAVNKGGESFPSETLSAYIAEKSKGTVIIVNGFHRTSAPAQINNDTQQGFDLEADPGIPYLYSASLCGYQQVFNRSRIGKETEDGLGYSGSELEGKIIVGNTFDYPFVHGKSIQRAGGYSFVSCSDETLESGSTALEKYCMVDYIYGADKKPLTGSIKQALIEYQNKGGKLFVSGEYIGSAFADGDFLRQTLQCGFGGSMDSDKSGEIRGASIRFSIPRYANESVYAVPAPECIVPTGDAYSVYVYSSNNYSAGVASKTTGAYTLGFPFECITDAKSRDKIMKSAMNLLLK